MTFSNLAASLEERLLLYARVTDLLGEAALAGDEEKLRSYAAMEEEAAAGIAALARCYRAREGEAAISGQPEALRPRSAASPGRPSPPGDRIRAAAARASLSSRRARDRLQEGREEVLRLLRENRHMRRSPDFSPAPAAPAMLDLRF